MLIQSEDMTHTSLTILQPTGQWGGLLPFPSSPKILSRNLCIAKIVLVMRISSWNFVRVSKAWLWGHVHNFGLRFSPQMLFLALYIFARLFWRARETSVKQPPGAMCPRGQLGYRNLLSWLKVIELSDNGYGCQLIECPDIQPPNQSQWFIIYCARMHVLHKCNFIP